MWFRKDGREESCVAGDAFYYTPGHTAGADAGAEFVILTPSDQVEELVAHRMRRAQQLQGATGN